MRKTRRKILPIEMSKMLNSRKSLTRSVVLVAPAFTVSGMKGEAGAVALKGLMIYALI